MEQQPSRLLSGLEGLLESKQGGMALNILIVFMVIAALLLPPVSAQERVLEVGYTAIDPEEGGAVVDPDGMQLTLSPEGLKDDVRIKEASVPMASFLDGSAGGALKEAAKALPANLLVKSPIYELSVKGNMPTAAVLSVPVPNNAEPYETLSLYEWTGEQWKFLPSQLVVEDDVLESRLDRVPQTVAVVQSAGLPAQVSAELPGYVSLPSSGSQALMELNPIGYYLGSDNAVEGSLSSLPQTQGQESYVVLPALRNWTDDGVVRTDLVDNMLIEATGREAHVQAIVNLVVNEMYGGIDLDYRGIDPALRSDYTAFVQDLARQLHANGKRLSLSLPAPTQVSADTWDTGAYDWAALGQAADEVKVPAPQDPAAYAPGGPMESLLWWAVGQVDRYKLQPVLSARSIEKAGQVLMPLAYRDALAKLSQVAVKAGGSEVIIPGQQVTVGLQTPGVQQDPATGQYWFSYQDEASGEQRSVWLEDATSMSNKLALLSRFNLGGVTVRDLWDEGNDPRLWELVRQYQASPQAGSAPMASDFSVVWSVENPSGGQMTEETRGMDQGDYVWTAPEEPGTYQIGLSIVANDGQTVAGGEKVAFVVEPPTPTPTPTPTETPVPPTPTPEPPTPTPVPPTATPKPKASGGAPKATAVPKASNPPVNTNFGYGIQAHMVDNGQEGTVMSKIKDMGFGWAKQQVEWFRFEPNKGDYQWGALDSIAAAANAAGVKVLWSVVKAPHWARGGQDLSVEGPPNNPQDFADYLGALAGHFCGSSVKAIEVWNEQNLHYEWGNQKIDPAAYMNLLKPAYNAIKKACPSMIVVSGALTPTGVNSRLAMDDANYLEGMYKNGLKNFSDAIGSHPSGYNVAPSVKGGQAACDFIKQQGSSFMGPCQTLHRSWSFNATLNRYYEIMKAYGDGNKKIWPTEFGWASGWTGAPGYEYANDNTKDEQAAWTAEAYKLMKQWGFVGVAFLWNLNFRVVNPTGEVAQWGIVAPDWSPLPAYNSLKSMPK